MEIEKLYKFLNSDKQCLKINRNLFNILSFESAVFYSYIVAKCKENIKKDEYKCFDEKIYFFSPVDEIKKNLKLTAFKQRTILNQLQKKNLLKVKYGHARTRYIWLNSDIHHLQELITGKDKLHQLEIKFINFLKEQENFEIEPQYLFHYIEKKYMDFDLLNFDKHNEMMKK